MARLPAFCAASTCSTSALISFGPSRLYGRENHRQNGKIAALLARHQRILGQSRLLFSGGSHGRIIIVGGKLHHDLHFASQYSANSCASDRVPQAVYPAADADCGPCGPEPSRRSSSTASISIARSGLSVPRSIPSGTVRRAN